MITKCPYCDYGYPDEPMSLDILRVLSKDNDMPHEDWVLWMQRLMETSYKQFTLKSYNGVKIHIGRKHKGESNWPWLEWSEQEKAVINANGGV